jgi:hypothetical protein
LRIVASAAAFFARSRPAKESRGRARDRAERKRAVPDGLALLEAQRVVRVPLDGGVEGVELALDGAVAGEELARGLCQNQPLSGGSWPNFNPL